MSSTPSTPEDILAGVLVTKKFASTEHAAPPPIEPPITPANGGASPPESSQERYHRLRAAQLEREEGKLAESERLQAAVRQQGRESVEKLRANQLANQSNCPHTKPNGLTALAGQRDHHHNLQILCQFCQKEATGWPLHWKTDNMPVPVHLYPHQEHIGGPTI